MSNLKYRTRGDSTPQGKPKVYFCCHPKDFGRFFERISKDILSKSNCALWYNNKGKADISEDLWLNLKQMQLFVMPVTSNLLCTENDTLNKEFEEKLSQVWRGTISYEDSSNKWKIQLKLLFDKILSYRYEKKFKCLEKLVCFDTGPFWIPKNWCYFILKE